MINSWRSVIALVVFLLTNLSVIFPTHISFPFPTSISSSHSVQRLSNILSAKGDLEGRRNEEKISWIRFPLNFQTTPFIAVLFLLATKIATGSDIRQGIVGDGGIQPLNIMALFISLAYLSVSLDTTGLFRFLAFWVAKKGGSSGRRLYFLLYVFFFVSGVIFGNDPVILSGTPFLAYFTRVSGITLPAAWIYAQFSVANMASAVLPPSNPTNLVLSGAFSISFLSYTAHTILPALAAAIAVFPFLLFGLFKSRDLIPAQIELVDSGSSTADSRNRQAQLISLTDKHGAIFGSFLFCAALIVLVSTSPLKVPVWEITVPPAIIMLIRDAVHDLRGLKKCKLDQKNASAETAEFPMHPVSGSDTTITLQPHLECDLPGAPGKCQGQNRDRNYILASLLANLNKGTFPTLHTIIPRLPISLVPFSFCMFIIVQTLTTRGWVEVFANWWKAWIEICERDGDGAAVVGAVSCMLLVSTLACNLCGTNIGTTILFARVLQAWLGTTTSDIDPRVRLGSIYALAIGTNFGAFTFTFSASLAGLLWRGILNQKGIIIHQWQFAVTNLPIIVIAITTAGAVLLAVMFTVSR